MEQLGSPTTLGLLSAAQYHGAAHHRPQEFQVMLAKSRRPIPCGAVRVAFIVRKDIERVPVQSFNTPRGTVLVSTPEATAVDLVGYAAHVGGLDQVATVLAELAEKIDPDKLWRRRRQRRCRGHSASAICSNSSDAGEQTAAARRPTSPSAQSRPARSAARQRPRRRAARRRLETLRQRRRGARAMIPRDYITEWRAQAPWVQDFQVEQDLVISRALVAIFSHPCSRRRSPSAAARRFTSSTSSRPPAIPRTSTLFRWAPSRRVR